MEASSTTRPNGESQSYAQKADAVRKDFNARFFDVAKHSYDKGSQTAQAMPLVVGLAPEDERDNVLNALVDDIRARENHVTAGDIGFHYVVDALLDGDRSDVLYDMLERTDTPSYGFQLAQGATALTEAWDANPNSSQDHFMLGHAEEWFYRGLGGINVDLSAKEPRQLVLRPQLVGKLTSVQTRYVSALGSVESRWKRGPAQTEYEFTIPANAVATVQLTSSSPEALKIDGAAPDKAAGVISTTIKSDRIELVLGSGQYDISTPDLRGEQ
jgi:alpha-L-rhamnosidase